MSAPNKPLENAAAAITTAADAAGVAGVAAPAPGTISGEATPGADASGFVTEPVG
jgi:hypothetical protein